MIFQKPRSFIPVYDLDISNYSKKLANSAINSGWISANGKYINEFENCFSQIFNGFNACATTNGTTALHLALKACGVNKNSTVIVPSFTYIATINAIKYQNATPLFVDINKDNWQIDLELLENIDSKKAQFVLIPHIYGASCDMDKLDKIIKKKKWVLIEDCAEALGSYFGKKRLGEYGECATFSFFGNKTVSTGEGGMIISKKKKIIEYCNFLKSHSMSPKKRYWHTEIGHNYRMTNIVAAIGVGQIKELNQTIKKKNLLHEKYKKSLSDLPIIFQEKKKEQLFWVTSLLFKNISDKEKITKLLDLNNVGWRPLFYPAHKMPMYKNYEFIKSHNLTISLSKKGIILPSYPSIREVDFKKVVRIIRSYFE